VIAGANIRINQKEQPIRLGRSIDYPSLLRDISKQSVAFYDVADCKAWLVDGASALLHLVRISLHLDETDPESFYDWRFDKTKLRENWPGATGRHAAMKTLSCWANLLLPVYVKDQVSPAGAAVEEYSTFQARVEKILHSLEILVDVQTYFASTEGIKIYQNIYLHKTISGFDILDFLQPLGPIGTRVKKIDFWGDGWMDLLPAAGIVAKSISSRPSRRSNYYRTALRETYLIQKREISQTRYRGGHHLTRALPASVRTSEAEVNIENSAPSPSIS
jgi:hypothetical protein